MAPQTTAAGNRHTQVGFCDPNDGLFIGGTGTAPAQGSSTGGGMLFLPATKNANRTTPNPDNTIVTGEDGEVAHEYDWPSIASRGFTVELSAEDLTQVGTIQNMPVNSWLGGQYSYEDITDVQVPNMMAVLQSRSKRISDGGGTWGGVVLPSNTARYLGRGGFNERGAALFRFFLTPNPSGYDQMGFSIFDNGGNQKYARGIPFQGLPYPLTFHAFKGDGSTVLFPVTKRPVSTSYAQAALERVAASLASVSTSVPYGITLSSAAGTTGKRGIFAYLFQ